MRKLENWLDAYMQWSENSEPAKLFRRWSGVAVIASCLQRKCWVKWGPKPIFPNLYIVLIGPSGSRKSYAMGQAMRFLLEPGLGIKLATDSTSRANLIRDFSESTQNYMMRNGTTIPHSSMTVLAPEFTVFLGERQMQLIMDLTDWYDSDKNPWVHKTLKDNAREIVAPLMNILAATTPELLQATVPPEAIGGGFIGRIIFLYAAKKEKKVVDEFETVEEAVLRHSLMEDLSEIAMMGGEWKISERALDFYRVWYNDYEEEEECGDTRFAGYFNRKPTTLKKLALILSASRGDDQTINLQDIRRAYNMLEEVESRMYHCLRGVGKNQHAIVMNKVMVDLAQRKVIEFKDLLFKFRDDISKFELEKVLEAMAAFGFCHLHGGKITYNESFSNGRKKPPSKSEGGFENDGVEK